MTNLSNLGNFQLGQVQLGASLNTITHFDSFSISDAESIDLNTIITEAIITFTDSLAVEYEATFEELMTFFENIFYPALAQAGILGRIVNPIDVTSESFCNAVLNTGQSLEINDVPARAFLQVKQRSQTFDNELKIQPGDAIMYTCPDLAIAVGDTVLHNFIEYNIITWIDRFFGGNIIFRKVALRRKALFNFPMPQITGLSVSANLEGKTTITWDEVDQDLFPTFDHYNVYRSPLVADIVDVNQVSKYFDIDGEHEELFSVGLSIIVSESTGKDGTYTVANFGNVGGNTRITVSETIPDATVDGLLAISFALIGSTKSNSIGDRNLVPNVPYWYFVKAVDKYGNEGEPSLVTPAGVDVTGPEQVIGGR